MVNNRKLPEIPKKIVPTFLCSNYIPPERNYLSLYVSFMYFNVSLVVTMGVGGIQIF